MIFTYGQMLMYGGIGLCVFSGGMLIAGTIVFTGKRKKLRKKLYDRYGF